MKLTLGLFIILILISSTLIWNLKKSNPMECSDCNVIVISLTNLRKDNLHLYGYKKNTTPNIDIFFKDSLKFNNAFAPASLTFTDSISLFYSLHPVKHNFMNRNDRDRVMPFIKQNKSLPKILKDNGYMTAAFVSDEDYSYENGIGDQFDYYFDKKYYESYGILFKPWQYNVGTKDLVKPAMKWLENNYQKKFFLFLQAYDVHCPYTPEKRFVDVKLEKMANPKIDFNSCFITLDAVQSKTINNKKYFELYDWHEFLNKNQQGPVQFSQVDIDYLISRYDSEISQADFYLKELIEKIKDLNLMKNTIIVFMSEHGDYLGENGYFMKAAVTAEGNLHNSNLGFPFLIKHPKINKMINYDHIFQLIDFSPTLLGMLGLDIPRKMQGKDYAEVVLKNEPMELFAFASASRKRDFLNNGIFTSEAIQNKKWKLTRFEHLEFNKKSLGVEYKLINLENDKAESFDQSKNEIEIKNQLIEKLDEKRSYYKK